MIEPAIALQQAIRAALIADHDVSALVSPDHIRAGSARPEKFPMIILGDGQTIFLGYASGSNYLARVYLGLHIWAIEDGASTAQQIGFAVMNALREAPDAPDFEIDEFEHPAVHWMRDPDPDKAYTHGVVTLEAVIRWKF